MEWIVLFFFAVYALLSVANQIESPLKKWLSRHDPLSLLPVWSFFAPIPGTFDERLVYRDADRANVWHPWKEFELLSAPSFFRCLWNPSKHRQKCVSDIIQTFLIEWVESENDAAVMLSWSYLQLLRLVMEMPQSENATHRQFAIVMTQGFTTPRALQIVYVSRKHALS